MTEFLKIFFMLLLLGTLIWFHLNISQLSSWWKGKPHLNILLFGPPILYLGYYSWQIIVSEFNSLWSARFITFSFNTIVFAILTWLLISESPMEPKTIICLLLSFMIILVQIFF